MKNKTNTEPMDERQQQITQRAICIAFIFLILCLLGVTIYRIITAGEVGWELFAIIGSSVVILVARRLMGDVEQPLDYRNRPLPTGPSKPERLARCRNYAVDSLLFGAAFGVADVLLIAFGENENSDLELTQMLFPNLGKTATIAVTAVIAFGTMFLVSFLLDYLVGEYYKVRRYNKMLSKLDAEE